MKRLDLTLSSPAENLACDEALLDAAESGQSGDLLRFWESREHFVVMGYSNKVAGEVNVAACEAANIPILRRCSGGGTVLQGPGCLNYALILKIADNGALQTITSANKFIMERNRAAIETEARRRMPQAGISIKGHTDLTLVTHHSSLIIAKKFSGNSQRRRKNHLLFHGTFLLNFDLTRISDVLLMPGKQPDYREHRAHADFIMNLGIHADSVKAALAGTWGALEALSEIPLKDVSALVSDRYSQHDWNFKF